MWIVGAIFEIFKRKLCENGDRELQVDMLK